MSINNLSSKIIIGTLSMSMLFSFFSHPALADTIGIHVSPATFTIEAKPPADIWTPFTIENTSDEPVTLQVGYKLFNKQASANGEVFFLQNGQGLASPDDRIFAKMQIVDDANISHNTIDLGPQQKERFRLRITLPTSEQTGDYYFSLIFLTKGNSLNQIDIKSNKNDQRTSSSFIAGIGINVFLAVGDKEIPFATITHFSTNMFRDQGPVPFTLTVENNGLHYITPHGTIRIKNMFNQTVGNINIPASTILAGTNRTFSSLWTEDFLLGFYTATLSFSLSSDGPTYTRNIHFLAVPLLSLLVLVIGIVIIIAIYFRIKRMMR